MASLLLKEWVMSCTGPRFSVPPASLRTREDFAELYEGNVDHVRSLARRHGVSEAALDDVTQETFIVCYRKFDEYDGNLPIRSWLAGILNRVVADHRRAYRRKDSSCLPLPPEDALPSSAPPPSVEAEQAESLRLAEELIAELDADKREVFVLAEVHQLTVPEIADRLGANINTVYARLRAARHGFEAAHARYQRRSSRPPRRASLRRAIGDHTGGLLLAH